MAIESIDHMLSRRAALLGFGAASVAILTNRLASLAQDATPEAVQIARRDHPLTGAWSWNINLDDEREPAPGIFYWDGAYIEYDTVAGAGLGFWQPTSERGATLVALIQSPGGPWNSTRGPLAMFEPDYVPVAVRWNRDLVCIRQDITVDEMGNGIRGSGSFTAYSGINGSVLYFTSMSRSGTRLVEGG